MFPWMGGGSDSDDGGAPAAAQRRSGAPHGGYPSVDAGAAAARGAFSAAPADAAEAVAPRREDPRRRTPQDIAGGGSFTSTSGGGAEGDGEEGEEEEASDEWFLHQAERLGEELEGIALRASGAGRSKSRVQDRQRGFEGVAAARSAGGGQSRNSGGAVPSPSSSSAGAGAGAGAGAASMGDERERSRLLRERRDAAYAAAEAGPWRRHEEAVVAWERRRAEATQAGAIAYSAIPWPPYDDAVLKGRMVCATAEEKRQGDEALLKVCFKAVSRRWHPDKFVARYGSALGAADRQRVLDRVMRISQAINAEYTSEQERQPTVRAV